MKKVNLTAIIISSLLFNCAVLRPMSIEDSDDGHVLIIDSQKIIKVVENWGIENGFQYVAYRRIDTITSSEWTAYANKYGAYGGSSTQFYSKVLVIGIDDPNNVPEKYNVVTVSSAPHQEMTSDGAYLLGTGIGLILGIILIVILSD